MLKSKRKSLLGWVTAALLLFPGGFVFAQDGTYSGYSPYSVYGIGELSPGGTATTRMMGGAGIGMRNRRIINLLNPAAITARDSLSFMADFSLSSTNVIYQQGDITSAHNTFNINSLAISFPIWRSSAMLVGLAPVSNMGYNFSTTVTDPALVGRVGNVEYTSSGSGSVYQLMIAGGVTLWDRLSLGAEFQYYFGNLSKATTLTFEETSQRDIDNGFNLSLHSPSLKLGAQYEASLPNNLFLTAGATWRVKTPLRGYVEDYQIATVSSVQDTLRFQTDTLSKQVSLPQELGFGLSLRKGDRWAANVDFTLADWGTSGFDAQRGFANRGTLPFASTVSRSVRGGFEFTPNRYDARYYFRRVTYRGGAYYNQAYYQVGGHRIDAYGLTFGITLPINNRLYNGISLGVDIGRRGSTADGLVRETYANFHIGFNIHDIWFRKYRYE